MFVAVAFPQNWQISSLNWQFFFPKLADFCSKFSNLKVAGQLGQVN